MCNIVKLGLWRSDSDQGYSSIQLSFIAFRIPSVILEIKKHSELRLHDCTGCFALSARSNSRMRVSPLVLQQQQNLRYYFLRKFSISLNLHTHISTSMALHSRNRIDFVKSSSDPKPPCITNATSIYH